MASSSPVSSVLAGRYANALFELADQKKKLDVVEKDLGALQALIDGSDELSDMIANPVVNKQAAAGAMAELATKLGADEITKNFLSVVAGNARLAALPSVIAAFRDEMARRRGEISAEVTAARELTAAQTSELEANLKKVVGSKVNINMTIDPDILGGLIVKVGSRMFDSSLKTKLTKLQLSMNSAAQ